MKPAVRSEASRRPQAPVARAAAGARAGGPARARRKFLRLFPRGFRDAAYLDTERGYKWDAHRRWLEVLDRAEYAKLLDAGQYDTVAARAVRVEQGAPYSFLFSFEKMALRDAVKSPAGARTFAVGLYDFLYGSGPLEARFGRWVAAVAALPRRQTRVLTWPLVTVFAFLAQPSVHLFLKPMATRAAAQAYGYPLAYRPRPSWETYASLLAFADRVRGDLRDLRPRDMIDIQSFLWVQGSDEYG